MIYVGIDTGVNTGFAVWDSKQRSLLQVCSLPIHKAMERVRSLYDEYKAGIGDKVIVRVEDPRQRTWFGTERMSREMERKKLQGVGSVKRDASIWDDYLKELGVEYEMVAPKRNVTKLTQERFRALTGWQNRQMSMDVMAQCWFMAFSILLRSNMCLINAYLVYLQYDSPSKQISYGYVYSYRINAVFFSLVAHV